MLRLLLLTLCLAACVQGRHNDGSSSGGSRALLADSSLRRPTIADTGLLARLLQSWQAGQPPQQHQQVQQQQARTTAAAATPSAAGDLPPLAVAKRDFLARYGARYGYNGWIDARWADEVGSRLPPGQHYLDFTGSGLYANSQLMAAARELAGGVFGNPHCTNPSAVRTDEELEAARARILAAFSADPAEYVAVFTRSATEALKIIGEGFPWSPVDGWQPPRRVGPGGVNETGQIGPFGECGAFDEARVGKGGKGSSSSSSSRASTFLYLRANHKSVLGVGAYARDRGAALACVDEAGLDRWLATPPPPSESEAELADGAADGKDGGVGKGAGAAAAATTFSLAAFPAKDNYEGRLYPLSWVNRIRARSTPRHRWLVALDAAAFVPTHPLNLTEHPADFVPVSFYKMFGYPTGVGALIVRRDAAALLRTVYFGGGSVLDATAEGVWRVLMPLPEALESGTTNFLDIVSLKHGFDLLERTFGGMQAVEAHVSALREWTYGQLAALRHANGAPLLRIFGAHERGSEAQSCVFQFVVQHANGSARAAPRVQADATAAGLHVRVGCDCNPGMCLLRLGITPEEERRRAAAGDLDKPFVTVLRPDPATGQPTPVVLPTGSVRASLGSLSTFEDVYALAAFLRRYLE